MKRLRQYRLLIGFGVSLVVALIVLLTPVSIPLAEDFRTPAKSASPSSPLIQGTEIAQRFPSREAPITSLALQFATYKRVNTGTLRVRLQALRDGQWQTVGDWTIEKDQLQDNAFQSFRLPRELLLPARTQLAVVITADGDPSQAISWWYDPTLALPDHQLLVNGTPQPGMGVFTIQYGRDEGSLITLLPNFWSRLTLFLNPGWQVVLALSIIAALSAPGLVVASYLNGRDSG